MPRVIGLDIATKTGWAVWNGKEWVTGVVDCSPSKGEPEGVRYFKLYRAMRYLLDDVDAAIIERTMTRSRRTAEVLSGLVANVLVLLEERGIEYAFVGAVEIKKHATGSGSADKSEMIRTAEEATGLRGLTDDEADAVHLVRYWDAHMRRAA